MTGATELIAGPGTPEIASRSASNLFWARFKEDRAALVAAGFLVFLVLIAIIGGPIAAKITGHPVNEAYPGIMEDSFGVPKGPNAQFWFGADGAGRDLFVRVLYGARTSLIVGVGASAIAVFVGLVVGMLAGYFGGWADTILSRAGDVMLAVPSLLISIGIVAACSFNKNGCLGGLVQPGIRLVILVIALFTWPYIARIVRGFTLSLRERGLRRGQPVARREQSADHLPGDPSEPARSHDRVLDAPRPAEHPLRGGALVPRAGRAARDCVVGRPPQRRAGVLRRRLVAHAVPRPVSRRNDTRLQPPRRRPS